MFGLLEYNQNNPVSYLGIYPSTTKTTKFDTRVPTRIRPKQSRLIPEHQPEYDQNTQARYPGTYPSTISTTNFGTRVPRGTPEHIPYQNSLYSVTSKHISGIHKNPTKHTLQIQ